MAGYSGSATLFTHAHKIGASGFNFAYHPICSTILKFSVVERLMIILSMGRHRLDATTTKFNQTDMAKLKMVSLHAFI